MLEGEAKDSHSTGTAGAGLGLLLHGLRLGGLAYAHGVPSLVNLPIRTPVLEPCDCSSSTTFPLVLPLVDAVVLLVHYLFDGLLPDTVVSKVIKLLQFIIEIALLHLLVDLPDQVLEGLLHVRGIQRTRLNELYLCMKKPSEKSTSKALTLFGGEFLRLGLTDLPLRLQITLVADQDDGYFFVSVVPHFLQPLPYRLEGVSTGDIVNEQHPDGLPVVRIRNGSIPFLTGSVPDLGPNQDVLNVDGVRGELNSNGGVRVTLELVFGISIE